MKNKLEEVIYQDSGIILNGEKLYKRVILETSITITERQFDEAWQKIGGIINVEETSFYCDLKKKLGF